MLKFRRHYSWTFMQLAQFVLPAGDLFDEEDGGCPDSGEQ